MKFLNLAKDLSVTCIQALRAAGRHRANSLLLDNRGMVEVIAQELVERGRLTAAEFKQLIGG